MSLLDKIKGIIQKYEDVIQVPTYTLSDGTVVSIDKLEVGGAVLLADGTIPTAGEWTLDDGTVITTDDAGLILTLVAPVAMDAVTLLDGTSVTISKLEAGGSVMVNGEPAKEGTYTLSDNTVITVDGTGLIVSVTPPATEVEVDYSNMTKDQFDALKQKFEGGVPDAMAMWAMVKALMESNFGWQLRQTQVEQITNDALTAYKGNYSKIEKENGELKALFTEVLSIVQEIAKEPAVEVPEKKTRASQFSKTKESQLERLAKAREEFKNKSKV